MKKSIYLVLIFIIFNTNLLSSPKDTGFIKWKQPNGMEFTARHWGDEFLNWMKTEDGYVIVDSPSGWFYYANLDKNGEYTATNFKVGIDKPPAISKDLKRSSARINEINNERELFNNYLIEKREALINTKSVTNSTVKLGVVLIDFPTQQHNTSANSGYGYFKIDFENMIFSDNVWYHTEDGSGGINYTPHPDGDKVFGSLRDYYDEMSVGTYQIVGKNNQPLIVNPADPNNPDLPDWLILDHEMSYYEGLGASYFMERIFDEAVNEYGSTEMNSYDAICFIYGGAVRTTGNFYPKAMYNKYCMGEHEYNSFAHIGTHAHEFAHIELYAHDEYEDGNSSSDPPVDPGFYSLMSYGMHNGPNRHASCPAPLSPYYRMEQGWVNPITIIPDEIDYTIDYGHPYPKFYKVNIPAFNEYFIIETKEGDGFDKYTPNPNGDNDRDGILIWHIDDDNVYDFEEIEFADNESNLYNENYTDLFPNPITSIQNFNNSTLPSSKLRNGTNSSISINNIELVGYLTGHIEVDVLDLPPAIPTGFSLAGNYGDNPTLSWNANIELDLDGYKLYRSVNGSGYSLLITLNENTTSYTDNGITIGNKFDQSVCYKLTSFDLAGRESDFCFPRCTTAGQISKDAAILYNEPIPEEYSLFSAYPNPFNPTTKIQFGIPENDNVKLSVYNMLGEKVADLVDDYLTKGFYEKEFDASKLSSGIYIYKIKTNNFTDVKKMMLVK